MLHGRPIDLLQVEPRPVVLEHLCDLLGALRAAIAGEVCEVAIRLLYLFVVSYKRPVQENHRRMVLCALDTLLAGVPRSCKLPNGSLTAKDNMEPAWSYAVLPTILGVSGARIANLEAADRWRLAYSTARRSWKALALSDHTVG